VPWSLEHQLTSAFQGIKTYKKLIADLATDQVCSSKFTGESLTFLNPTAGLNSSNCNIRALVFDGKRP
jgi:hypothetical protein